MSEDEGMRFELRTLFERPYLRLESTLRRWQIVAQGLPPLHVLSRRTQSLKNRPVMAWYSVFKARSDGVKGGKN